MRRMMAALALLAAPLAAQAGFLEDLFGIRPQQPAPYEGLYAPREIVPDRSQRLPVLEVPVLRVESTCCKHGEDPMQALLHDDTLIRGDVVMTTEGLRAFMGARAPHTMRDFVPVSQATTMSAERKRQLLALDR